MNFHLLFYSPAGHRSQIWGRAKTRIQEPYFSFLCRWQCPCTWCIFCLNGRLLPGGWISNRISRTQNQVLQVVTQQLHPSAYPFLDFEDNRHRQCYGFTLWQNNCYCHVAVSYFACKKEREDLNFLGMFL